MTEIKIMPDKSSKWPDNVPGKMYVDESCIACDACIISAPDNFSMNPDDGHAFLIQQPRTASEEEQCREAMEGCPVEAIGNDGEED
jgi:ferredoxin